MLKFLREKNPSAQIVALAVLPRGWTDAWHVYDWPSMYKPGIDAVNRALKDYAAEDDAVHYLDCGPAVTPNGKVRPSCRPGAVLLSLPALYGPCSDLCAHPLYLLQQSLFYMTGYRRLNPETIAALRRYTRS